LQVMAIPSTQTGGGILALAVLTARPGAGKESGEESTRTYNSRKEKTQYSGENLEWDFSIQREGIPPRTLLYFTFGVIVPKKPER